jgi:hypothetical protein
MPHTELLEERLKFLSIDRDVVAELKTAKTILEPAMDEMLERFYTHILAQPKLRTLFQEKDAIDRARSAQKSHWLKTLFEGKYDRTYYEKAAQIGRTHARVGLTPNWYIGGYCQMLGQFVDLIEKTCAEEGKPAADIVQAVSKVIFLDMDLVIHCYLDAKDSSMRQVLRRATDFTADVNALGVDLNAAAAQINATAQALMADAARQRETTAIAERAHSKPSADSFERISELVTQAQELTRQTTRLDERLKELQFKDKLYIDDDVHKSGTIARLKALVLGK